MEAGLPHLIVCFVARPATEYPVQGIGQRIYCGCNRPYFVIKGLCGPGRSFQICKIRKRAKHVCKCGDVRQGHGHTSPRERVTHVEGISQKECARTVKGFTRQDGVPHATKASFLDCIQEWLSKDFGHLGCNRFLHVFRHIASLGAWNPLTGNVHKYSCFCGRDGVEKDRRWVRQDDVPMVRLWQLAILQDKANKERWMIDLRLAQILPEFGVHPITDNAEVRTSGAFLSLGIGVAHSDDPLRLGLVVHPLAPVFRQELVDRPLLQFDVWDGGRGFSKLHDEPPVMERPSCNVCVSVLLRHVRLWVGDHALFAITKDAVTVHFLRIDPFHTLLQSELLQLLEAARLQQFPDDPVGFAEVAFEDQHGPPVSSQLRGQACTGHACAHDHHVPLRFVRDRHGARARVLRRDGWKMRGAAGSTCKDPPPRPNVEPSSQRTLEVRSRLLCGYGEIAEGSGRGDVARPWGTRPGDRDFHLEISKTGTL
eukprot:scaffold431_cov334-Pavlova_lutheri.AAC.123